jgi:hypothetical protein
MSVARPISSLSKMMVERTEAALREKDYENALEHILTVASVDDHPEVTTALTATALWIVDDLKFAPGASVTLLRLLMSSARSDMAPDYDAIRQCFDRDTVFHILDLVRRTSWSPRRRRFDHAAAHLVENINRALDGKSPESFLRPSKNLSGQWRGAAKARGVAWFPRRYFVGGSILNVRDAAAGMFARMAEMTARAFRELSMAVLGVAVLTLIMMVFSFARETINSNATIIQHLFSKNRCYTYVGEFDSFFEFFITVRGIVAILSFLVLRKIRGYVGGVRMEETRELGTVIVAALMFLYSILVLDSPNILHLARDTAKICHDGHVPAPLSRGD